MLLIVISPENNIPQEHQILFDLFSKGLTHFHLRKPDATKRELETYIQAIPVRYHRRIIIHSHYELALSYNLKGIHLTEKTKQNIKVTALAQMKKMQLSASFHNLKALQLHRRKYSYVFLSPIFNSISKQGYTTTFKAKELTQFLSNFHKQKNSRKVIALGGINITRIQKVKAMGFDGIAVLGAIWQIKQPAVAFSTLQARLPG